MSPSIAEANAALRNAVEQRREAQARGIPHEEWYGDAEPMPEETSAEESLHPATGCNVAMGYDERPGSLPFLELLEELRTLHYDKTASYGGAADPFENVTASAKCGVEPWRRALCDLSDCVVRMQKYATGQPVDYENALIDAANWALICLLKLREAKRA